MAIPGMQTQGPFRFIDSTGKHRSLTREEVDNLRDYAESTTPSFLPPDNAAWDDHHPIAREVWEKKGLKPEEIKAKVKEVQDLEAKLAELRKNV